MILVSENNIFHKVFPKIIEDKFLKSGYIKAISVIGRENKEKTNDLVAFLVIDGNTSDGQVIEQLMKYADNNFESYERPDEYIVIDKLPLTTVGKEDYRLLERKVKK